MDQSSSKIGPEALERRYAAQTAPLSHLQVAAGRGIVIAFPLVVVAMVALAGVSATRIVEASVLFAAVVVGQLLLMAPARRRQVLGRPATTED